MGHGESVHPSAAPYPTQASHPQAAMSRIAVVRVRPCCMTLWSSPLDPRFMHRVGVSVVALTVVRTLWSSPLDPRRAHAATA